MVLNGREWFSSGLNWPQVDLNLQVASIGLKWLHEVVSSGLKWSWPAHVWLSEVVGSGLNWLEVVSRAAKRKIAQNARTFAYF